MIALNKRQPFAVPSKLAQQFCGLLLALCTLPVSVSAQPLEMQAGPHPRAPQLCASVNDCLNTLLQQAGSVDMRPSMEAMHQLLQMPGSSRKIFIASGEWQRRARQAVDEGNLSVGRELLLQALVISPEHPMLHLQLGQILLSQGNLSEAAQSFRQALRFAPWLSEAWEGIAQVSLAQQDAPQAVAALVLAYEWAKQKPARKAHYLRLANQTIYAQALEKIKARNIAAIAAWQNAKPASDAKPQLLQRQDFPCQPPEYPLQAQRVGAEGQVKFTFLMDLDGSILSSQIVSSSGNLALDVSSQIALHACFGLHLRPPLKQRLSGNTQFDWRLE